MTRTSPIETLLERLDRVRPTGQGKWTACCPAHDDRTPSLSIREADDGTVLLRCWSGCEFSEIVAAVGLEPRHLFPRDPNWRPAGRGSLPPFKRPKIAHSDALILLHQEAITVHVAACDVLETANDREVIDRLALAIQRIGTVIDAAEVMR